MSRVSTNDLGRTQCKYLHPVLYRAIALERLQKDRGLLSPAYRELLERQVAECDYEIWKKGKSDGIIQKTLFLP